MLPQAGQLPTVSAVLYTVPSKFSARLEWIQLVIVTAATVQLFATIRGRQVKLTASTGLSAGVVNVLEGVPFRLGAGDSISGVSTQTDTDFLLNGEELRNEGN
jgi:hypothetical protein